jgi:hypothetical protein
MTAEIGVLNKTGVALAADSAVTIGNGRKIYNTANKLFSLSKYHPVGVMIYGNANFMGAPLETIIKVYRQRLGEKYFNKIEEYANDFIEFLKNSPYHELSSASEQDRSAIELFDLKLDNIRDEIIYEVKEFVNSKSEQLSKEDLERYFAIIVETRINQKSSYYKELPFLDGFTEDDNQELCEKYAIKLTELIEEKFENLPLEKEIFDDLIGICINFLLKEFTENKTGLVIAGFGESEIYPSLFSFNVDGKVNDKLKLALEEKTVISEDDSAAAIIPFAQSEMVHTFIGGIDPEIEKLSNEYLGKLFHSLPEKLHDEVFDKYLGDPQIKKELVKSLNEKCHKLFQEYISNISGYKKEYYINPIIGIVKNLPKDELAEMAEALVNLTSFKRRVSSSLETVGGPVDVAVITKGDGFIWIKRKHYFEPDLNKQFFQKYLRSEQNDSIIAKE